MLYCLSLCCHCCFDGQQHHRSGIEYIQNLSDELGNIVDPIKPNMPADFPKDTETMVTFKKLGEDKTEMAIKECADFGQMFEFAKIGLEQCLDKMAAIFDDRTK
jgi:hypothetical protein